MKTKSEHCCQKDNILSKHQLWLNWCLVFLFGFYKDSGHTILLPTLHQYVTNPTNISCGNPGLGGSETVYSLAAGMYNGGKIMGTLSVAILTHFLGFKMLFSSGVLLQMIGFLIYGLSSNAWTIVLSRVLVGYNSGIIIALPFAYFGKSVKEYCKLSGLNRKKGRKLKNQLVYLSGFITTSNCILTLSLVMIIAQFPNVDQFRWTAWFQVIAGVTVLLLAMLFRDSHQMCSKKCCVHKEKTLSNDEVMTGAEIKEHQADRLQKHTPPMVIFTICYLVLALYNTNSFLSVKEALTNPILSDYYGFTVELQSYFFMGVLLLIPLTCLTLLLLDHLHIDGRVFYLGLLLMSTLGLLLLGDWQTLGSGDQCNNFSITDTNNNTAVHSLCDMQSCASLQLLNGKALCSESGNNTNSRLQTLIEEQSYITVYQPQNHFQSVSQLEVLPQCPSCSNHSNGVCIIFTLESGVICSTEEDQQAFLQEETGSALLYDIPEYQTQLCIVLREELSAEELSAEELNSSCLSLPVVLLEEITSLPFTAALQSQQQCESRSGSPYYCYWNQDSLIAGEHCPDCPPLCRSTRKIPHFAQVFLSVGLLTIVAGGGVWVIGGLMVEVSPVKILSLSSGISGFFGALSRVLTPIWGNLVYVAAGRHTILPIIVMLLFQIPVYLGLALTWKQLKPKHSKDKELAKKQDDKDRDLSTLTSSTEESQTQGPKTFKEDDEYELEFDLEKEKIYQMYSVKLETQL